MGGMKVKLQEKLKEEGRSLRWFHREYIKGITYNAMALQLNGYAVISTHLKQSIRKYMESNGETGKTRT